MVVSKLSDFVFVNRADARTIAAVEILAWWRRSVRIGVIESGSIGRKNRAVRAFLFCDPRQASSVERDTVEVTFQRGFFRRRKIDKSPRFINSVDCRDFPFALGYLRKLFAFKAKQVQVAIPAALARPQEALAVLQKIEIITDVNPIRIIFAERGARLACSGVCNQEIECGLRAIEALNREMLRIHKPVHARNVNTGFRSGVHRTRFTAV